MPTYMKVHKRIIPKDNLLPWLAFHIRDSDKVCENTSLWKLYRELEHLRWEMEWNCHKRGII